MGLFTLTVAGGGFLLIGVWESLSTTTNKSSSIDQISSSTAEKSSRSISSSSVSFIAASVFSFLFALNSLISFFDAVNSGDRVGSALQLQVIAVASLFLLYSVMGLLVNFSASFPLSPKLLNLVLLFAFVEEFLLYYLQRKDTIGIENRYFDLLLVPITICIFSTVLELKSPNSSIFPKLARGVGLILQGMWFLQMGLSFFTSFLAHGCSLVEKSRGNYTIKCKDHPEYHRARAIATLQFNCHLALLVSVLVGVYSVVAQKKGIRGDFTSYRPLGEEIQQLDSHGKFTLDSDEDGDDGIKEEESLAMKKGSVVELTVNGYGSHH